MQPDKLYHYSVSTLKMQPLLGKSFIVESILRNLEILVNTKKIKLYGYTISSNRLELLWALNFNEHEESPHIQFLKNSSFDFITQLRKKDKKLLSMFCTDMFFQKIQFWQKSDKPIEVNNSQEAMAVLGKMHILSRGETKQQKMYNSSLFYKNGVDPLGLITNYKDFFTNKVVEFK